MLFDDDERLMELFNKITNSKDSNDRIRLALQVARDVGRWMMCDSVLLDQLATKLALELDTMERNPLARDIAGALMGVDVPEAMWKAHRTIGMIKAFLEIRPQFKAALQRHVPHCPPIPD